MSLTLLTHPLPLTPQEEEEVIEKDQEEQRGGQENALS
jgi:hypothetical protein